MTLTNYWWYIIWMLIGGGDTIEEKIVELQQAKQSLADTVTGGADGAILSMNPEQLLQLLGEEA